MTRHASFFGNDSGRMARIRDLLRWWQGEEPPAFEPSGAAGAELRGADASRACRAGYGLTSRLSRHCRDNSAGAIPFFLCT